MSGQMIHDVPASAIRKMGRQSARLRFIMIYDAGVPSPKIAAVLRVTSARVDAAAY